ncbi:MAG: FixH family protein [Nitrosomonadales bacterium]|nr:FixH family protein [Nitrosomonadales bacterium]
MSISLQLKNDLKSPWLRTILAIIVVTVSVNLAFVFYAFWSPPQLVAKDYYEKGQNYFHEEIKREQQAGAAWRLQLLIPPRLDVRQPQTLRLYAMDHQGNPLRSGEATLYAYRPNHAQEDFRQELKLVDDGTFAAEVAFPLPGKWDLIAQVRSGDQKYDVAQRIDVQR